MSNHTSQRWLIYALGGGLGHLTRAVALSRAAIKSGHSVRILTNSPFASELPLDDVLGQQGAVVHFDSTLHRDQIAPQVMVTIEKEEPDVLIVDTFPRGLGGELADVIPELSSPKVLIHRDLNPRYIEQFELEQFARHYDQIILPGEPASFASMPLAIMTAPWLISDPGELHSERVARGMLHSESDNLPIVVVVGCGKQNEIDESRTIAGTLHNRLKREAIVRFVSPTTQETSPTSEFSISIWPLMPAMSAVSVVVGSGGYNTVNEARAMKIPLVAIPRQRLYDRQPIRLHRSEIAIDVEDVITKVSQHIERLSSQPKRSYIDFENGVHEAVRTIEKLVSN